MYKRLIVIVFLFGLFTVKGNGQDNVKQDVNQSVRHVFLDFGIGFADPLLNLGSPVYLPYNQETDFRSGFGKLGFGLSLSGGYYFKNDWGLMAKVYQSAFSFNGNAYSNSRLSQGDTIASLHAGTNKLSAYLLGFVMRMPEGVASLNKHLSIEFYALGGILDVQYPSIGFIQNAKPIDYVSINTAAFGVDVGTAVLYSFTRNVGAKFSLDVLAGNAVFADQSKMSIGIFNTNIAVVFIL